MQNRCKGDNATVIFGKAGYRLFRSSYDMDSCGLKQRFNECAEYKLLEVEVSLKFLGTAGFSAHREGCYIVAENVETSCSCICMDKAIEFRVAHYLEAILSVTEPSARE